MEEQWKPIIGYEGFYEISNYGKVRSLTRQNGHGGRIIREAPKILKLSKTTTGYWKIELKLNGKRNSYKVHRLVLFAFVGDPPPGKEITNHKDGNRLNNYVDNLEWCSQRENVLHAVKTGLRKTFYLDKEQLQELYLQKGAKKVGEIFGVSTTTTIKLLNIHSIPIRHTGTQIQYGITEDFLVRELKVKTQKQIAEELNCDKSLISIYANRIKKRGYIYAK